MDLQQVLSDLKRREGGFVNHPSDRGGATKYGITMPTLSRYLGRRATIEDIKNLDWDTAEEIYKADYYYAPRINTLPEALQPQLFDIAVNSGSRRAITMLQEVINMAGFECDVDGAVGPQTRKAAIEADAAMGPYLINAISEYREYFYNQIVANDPSQAVFLKGWLNRAREFRCSDLS